MNTIWALFSQNQVIFSIFENRSGNLSFIFIVKLKTQFTHCSAASIADFEQIIASRRLTFMENLAISFFFWTLILMQNYRMHGNSEKILKAKYFSKIMQNLLLKIRNEFNGQHREVSQHLPKWLLRPIADC